MTASQSARRRDIISAMKPLVARIGFKLLEMLSKLMTWRWSKTKEAWIAAWHEPLVGLRFAYMALGAFAAYVLIPFAFNELGFLGGISYLVALFGAISNATVFRIVSVGRTDYLPMGVVTPVAALLGVFGSKVIRPFLGDAKEAALAQDFIGAFVILAVFVFMTLWFRRLQSGKAFE